MERAGYILLLNNTLKEHILSFPSQEKRRLREKFEFLENGIWDAGVRVKKLRGVSNKVIFEARLSKDQRMLFTLGRHGEHTAIYLWGIVRHDDVGNTAQVILPANTPFLQFESPDEEELPDVVIDDLDRVYYSQEDIEEKAPDDHGPQKWLVLTDGEWRRLLISGGSDNLEMYLFLTSEQKKVLELEPPVLLSGTAGSGKTTIAVYYLLRREFADKKCLFLTCSPYLKRFSRRIYDGLVLHTDLEKSVSQPDFYILRDLMIEIISTSGKQLDAGREVRLREFETIFSSHSLYRKYDTELVWEEIRSIIKGAKPPLNAQRYKTLLSNWLSEGISQGALGELRDYLLGLKNFGFMEKIQRALENKTRYSSFDEFIRDVESGAAGAGGDASFLLHELLKIIEKKAHSFSYPLLSFEEYQMLGKKRAPNFLFDRKDIYSIAQYYQSRLDEQGLWDEIDLARRALKVLTASPEPFLYDLVVCDEVQDLCDIQLALVFRLVKSCRNLLLAGDTKQIINPSGFRWEEVKDKFYERDMRVPGVISLNLNFRCVGNIVKLGNALLDLKQRLVGLSGSELREEWKFNGKPPFLIYGIKEDEFLRKIRITGAGQIILVRTASEGERLKKLLNTELVFTISEAKGLEFDTVCLWHFSQDEKAAGIWRKIKSEHNFDRSHYPHIKHEINLLYVAVTRARNTLIIYDGEGPSDVWEVDALADRLYRTDRRDDLQRIWQRVSSPSEWEEQGQYFYEREYYSAAIECFRNSGNIAMAETAEAFVLERKKEHEKAAELFEKHGHTERAAVNFERAEMCEKALTLWEKLGDSERAQLCRIGIYEKEGDYNRAAFEWEKRGDYANALKNWERAQNNLSIAEYYLSKKRYEEAASKFEQAGRIEEACSLYKKLRMHEKEASLQFKAGNYQRAAGLYKKLKNTEALINCYEKLNDYRSIGMIHEKARATERAVEYFAKFARGSEENRRVLAQEAEELHRGRKLLRSALRYSALGMYDRSGPIYLQNGRLELAVKEFEKIGDPVRLSECYVRMGDYYQAAVELERAENTQNDGLIEGMFEKHIHQNRMYDKKRADKLFLEASDNYKRGKYEKALRRYRAIGFPEGIYEAYLKLDRDDEALGYFLENDMFNEVEDYIEEKPSIEVSPEFLRQISGELFEGRHLYYDVKYRKLDLGVKLMETCLKSHRDEETVSYINDLATKISNIYYFGARDPFPKAFLDLALELNNYNALFKVLSWKYHYPSGKKLPKKFSTFLTSVWKKGELTNDPGLMACYYYFHDRQKFEEIVAGFQPGPENLELFERSSNSYRRAVDYHLRANNINRAAWVARINKDVLAEAGAYEKVGDFRSAGRVYRDAKNYEEALRCFQRIQDAREIARVYERMKEYQAALDIWQRLGNEYQARRLEKKLRKQQQEKDQLGLF